MIKKNSKTQKCQNRHGKKCTQFRGKNVYYSNIQELSRKLNIPIIQARKIEKDNGRRIIIGPGNDTLLINIKDENFSGLLKKIFNIKRINNKQLIEDTHIQNKNLDIVKELGPNAEGKYMLTITMYISFPSPSYVDEEEILTKGKVDNNKIQELLDEDNPRLVKRLLNDVYNGYNDEIPSYVKNKVMEFMKRMKNSKPKLLHHEFRIGDAYKNRKLNFKKGYVRDFNNVFELTEWVNIEYNKDIFTKDTCGVKIISKRYPELYWQIKKLETMNGIMLDDFMNFCKKHRIGFKIYNEHGKELFSFCSNNGLLTAIVFNNHIYPTYGGKPRRYSTKEFQINYIDNSYKELEKLLTIEKKLPSKINIDSLHR